MYLNFLMSPGSWESEMWQFMTQMSVIAISLLIGHILSKEVAFFKRNSIPAAVTGGMIVFFMQLIPSVNNLIDRTFMMIVAFHALGLGFVAITLRKSTSLSKKRVRHKALKTGMTTVNTYILQGIIGILITILLSVTIMPNLVPGLGVLASMALGRETAHVYDNALSFTDIFQSALNFALVMSVVGFILVTIGGAIAQRKHRAVGLLPSKEESVKCANEIDKSTWDEIGMSDCADKFTMQMVIVLFVYFLAFLIMLGLSRLAIAVLGNFGEETLRPLIFSINFVFAVNAALIFKGVTGKLKDAAIIQQDYVNNFMLNRIVGFMFDILIVATIASFDPTIITQIGFEMWVVIILIVVPAIIATWFYLKKVSPILFPNYTEEGFFMMFGNLVGTAGISVMLLKEIDPKLETPASRILTLQSLPAVIIGIPLIILIPFAANGLSASLIVLGSFVAMFIVFNMIIFHLGKKVVE